MSNPTEALQHAINARDRIRETGTDAMRIVDGRGDGLDGIEIESYAGHWLVRTRDAVFPEWLREIMHPADRRESLGPRSMYWQKLGEEKTAPVWIGNEVLRGQFAVREHRDMRFWIDFNAGYSQGLFLDQRENRREVRNRALGLRVLNCFAYTCSFGVAAALGGAAETLNVDLSKRYLKWGERNYELNGVTMAGSHEFIYGDVRNWLERLARKGRKFDIVILDPPTFSRDDKGKVFTIESGYPGLVRMAEALLTEKGAMFCSTNQRTLAPEAFRLLIGRGLTEPRRWTMTDRRMPPDFTGEQYLKAVWVEPA